MTNVTVEELRAIGELPLTATQKMLARKLRVQWLAVYNNLKARPGGGAAHASELSTCEDCLAIIDAVLALQPRIH